MEQNNHNWMRNNYQSSRITTVFKTLLAPSSQDRCGGSFLLLLPAPAMGLTQPRDLRIGSLGGSTELWIHWCNLGPCRVCLRPRVDVLLEYSKKQNKTKKPACPWWGQFSSLRPGASVSSCPHLPHSTTPLQGYC